MDEAVLTNHIVLDTIPLDTVPGPQLSLINLAHPLPNRSQTSLISRHAQIGQSKKTLVTKASKQDTGRRYVAGPLPCCNSHLPESSASDDEIETAVVLCSTSRPPANLNVSLKIVGSMDPVQTMNDIWSIGSFISASRAAKYGLKVRAKREVTPMGNDASLITSNTVETKIEGSKTITKDLPSYHHCRRTPRCGCYSRA